MSLWDVRAGTTVEEQLDLVALLAAELLTSAPLRPIMTTPLASSWQEAVAVVSYQARSVQAMEAQEEALDPMG